VTLYAVRQFSPPHLAALAVMVVGICAAVLTGRRRPSGRVPAAVAWALAAVIFVAWAGEYVDDVIEGTWSIQFTLPLQLTDLISLVSIAALLTRRVALVEMAYFWAFTATLQAVLTPDLAVSFPNVLYFTYFGYHVGAIIAAAFLVFGLRLYPRRGAVWRTFAATLAWACVAGLADVITGGNYMYLAWKPAHNSLLSLFGPWPWYIAGGTAVGLVLLGVVRVVTTGLIRLSDPAAAAAVPAR
jgi:hypothetical integral membrane protein (TIGR02206 family)